MSDTPANGSFASVQDAAEFMMHYYEHPDPDRIPALVRSLAEAGHLDRRQENSAALSFLAACLRQDGTHWREWLQVLRGASFASTTGFFYALWLSGIPDAEELFSGFTARDLDGRGRPPDLTHDPVDTPVMLDFFWGAFFATGDAAHVRRIMEALALKGDVLATITRAAARWSLGSNIVQHTRVREICQQVLDDAATAPELRSELEAMLRKG